MEMAIQKVLLLRYQRRYNINKNNKRKKKKIRTRMMMTTTFKIPTPCNNRHIV